MNAAHTTTVLARLRSATDGSAGNAHRLAIIALVAILLAASGGAMGAPAAAKPRSTTEVRSSSPAAKTATAKRPNIVVLMLDDVGADDGRMLERLPSIRSRFLERGLRFADFHGETPTCCPGRVGFLTGLHTHHHRVTRNDGSLLRPSMTLATQLRRRGYFTILGGKYVNLYQKVRPKVPPGWSEFHAIRPAYYDYSIWSDGRRERHAHRPRDYSTDVVTRKLLTALDRAPRRRPVFVWAAPFAAHTPHQAAPRHQGDPRCSAIPRWRPPGYMERDVSDKPAYVRRLPRHAVNGMDYRSACETLLSVDDLLRRVTAKLRSQGRLANTLFILTSDNGMNYGMHRLLGIDKRSPYATQVPFYASWLSRIGLGRPPVSARLQNIDLAPTLCELAGCRLGPYPTGQRRPDGESFRGLLLGDGGAPRRRAVLSSFLTPGADVPRWYGVTSTRSSPLAAQGCQLAARRGCRWSYTRYESGAEELYDISNGPCWRWRVGDAGDPCRLQNLARSKRYRTIKTELERQLAILKR